MLLDIVDTLRCIAGHEESWLVASAETWHGRQLMTGTLGCPVCRAEYRIRNGVADFRRGLAAPRGGESSLSPASIDVARVETPRAESPATHDDAELAIRLAAQLDLRDPGGIVLLSGAYGRLVGPLAAFVQARYLVLNPVEPDRSGEASPLLVAGALPLAARSLRAAAVDADVLEESARHAVVRALRPGGRLLARTSMAMPAGVREIARDATEWVGESTTPEMAPVQLSRRGG